MNFLAENWLTLMGFLSAPIMYFLGGRQEKKQQLQKGNVEIETAEVDLAKETTSFWREIVEQNKNTISELKLDRVEILTEYRTEKEYFRSQIDELRKQSAVMQEQFNSIQLAYAKEVEQSQNWEKLHRQLLDKFNALNKDHEELKLFCEKLKVELDKYKKTTK